MISYLSIDHTLFFPRMLAAWLTSPGGLNIVFLALNIVQRPQHRFLATLWHKNDVFDEKKGVWGHTCRMFSGRREPTSLRRRQNDQKNTLKFGQKHHFYATILARGRQNGPKRRQTLKSGEPRSPDPGFSTGMCGGPKCCQTSPRSSQADIAQKILIMCAIGPAKPSQPLFGVTSTVNALPVCAPTPRGGGGKNMSF